MLTDNELKEIGARHKHEWDDGFEDIPLLIDEIERRHWEIVLLHQSLRAHAEKIESLNAVIDALTDKLTAAGITVDVKNAEIEKLWAELTAAGRRAVLSQAEIERLDATLYEINSFIPAAGDSWFDVVVEIQTIARAARNIKKDGTR
jgi:chromosome segregation ATPase